MQKVIVTAWNGNRRNRILSIYEVRGKMDAEMISLLPANASVGVSQATGNLPYFVHTNVGIHPDFIADIK